MVKKKVYVVPHCHWDAEWYFTCEDSHILLVENMDYLLDLLEKDADFPSYTFDGLAIVLDDYLKERPENTSRIHALIRQRRLFVGPWYTQCDSLLIRTESLIRNLQYGIRTATQFGHSMNVGYLPDIFGQHAWLPAFFTDAGIDFCVLQRGIYTDQLRGDLNFYWQAPNQKSIGTNYLYYGYGPGKFLSAEPDYLQHRLLPILEQLSVMNRHTDKLLLPCGGDQVLPNAQYPQTVNALNQRGLPYQFVMSDYESYMRETWRDGEFTHVIEGELFACQKSRIHRTCHSTRYDIKRQTWETEHLLLDKLEPLTVMASLLGIHWPQPLMASLWKTLFCAHAHNGIEATNADPVNQNIKQRLISVERSALSLINLLKKKISHAISLQSEQRNILVVFNSDISPLDSVVQAVVFTKDKQVSLRRGGKPVACTVLEQRRLDGGQQVIVTAQGEKLETVEGYYRSVILFRADGLHGLGYQTWLIDEQTASPSLTLSHDETIENARLRISLQQGVLSLENRGTGQRIDNLLTFVDCGDDGDEFDFAPVEHEQPVSVSTFTLIACETSPMVSRMTLETTLVLPKDMQQRRNAAPTQPMTIQTTLELRQHENYVRVQHHLVNEARDHRLRVHIRTPVKAPDYAFADQGYALLRRETRSRYVNGWREQGFVEKPVPVYTLENCVALRDDNHLFAAITKGIKEYEVLPDEDVLALTLFRSVGLLGKDDTPWRPGRASGINNKIVDTPDAQMLQPMTFDYALMMDSGIDDAALFNECKQYREHYLSYQLQQLNTFEERLERFTIPLPEKGLAPAFTWLTQNNPAIQMSMCRPGDGEHTVIIRLFNPGDTPQTVELASPFICRIYRLSLLEEIQEMVKDNPTIAAKDYLTLAIHLMQDHSHE
ncbi:glycoside hydrolase family 38 C-terminal domain-containing protein [Cronobacter sakazakii]|uniref:glycoside hydrolase family 38 N-terminal domain-containing protein n=1 Tax=Cronobacter sakazakii TaxID=28141 RepID=UPI0028128C09|nr:glycoside hydrolase family 38 C-terminal domain-containing protein [Cronobacter sakazakii]MDQ9174857.1 glycoside hydrolase family 38 C-terminal domain-containing protein [Cronobacter sakazakii]MDQ9180839.1 glycoside hydrolase family 38 C-terminal domain-containing protein [Cronobacter sakazakii]MDQ9201950.1 glycoside hydrolase family 38 C-terminal domain-containing protein [Cronobacter sakazakii]